jgi:hypothetical protein
LEFYKNYFHTIYIFSPTVLSDDKWVWVKKQPLLAENKRLKKFLKKDRQKEQNANPIVKPPPETPIAPEQEEEFSPFIPTENFIPEVDLDDIKQLMDDQMKMIRYLKKKGESRHLANRVLFIFDDVVGSDLFNPSKSNPFRTFNSNHRHYSFSAIIISQFYREIQKLVRVNFSCMIFYEISNEKELDVIFDENPVGLNRKEWQEVYEHCVEGDYNFMFINYCKPKRLRIAKNFDNYVVIKKE